jgi:hypothetical protein
MHSSTSSSDHSLRRFLRTLAVWVLGLFVGGEVLLRAVGVEYPDLGYPDLDRGWRLRANAAGWVREENPAGVYVKINSDGMRDREHRVEKAPGVFRVALLGNSYTDAFAVPLEQTYWKVAEEHIAGCLPPGYTSVEFLNFGVAGYGTAQEFITLQKYGWQYQPDAVLLAFLTSHDAWYNKRELVKMPLSPYYIYKDGQLVLDDSFRQLIRAGGIKRIRTAVEEHLRTVQFLNHWRVRTQQWVFEVMQGLRGSAHLGSTDDIELREVDQVYVAPRDGNWEEAWKVTEGILGLIKEEARAHGVPFWLASLSNAQQVHPDSGVGQAWAKALGTDDLFYPDRRIKDIAGRIGVPIVQLAPEMAEIARERKVFLHGFAGSEGIGHWNETGNRVAGEILARGLCGLLARRQD